MVVFYRGNFIAKVVIPTDANILTVLMKPPSIESGYSGGGSRALPVALFLVQSNRSGLVYYSSEEPRSNTTHKHLGEGRLCNMGILKLPFESHLPSRYSQTSVSAPERHCTYPTRYTATAKNEHTQMQGEKKSGMLILSWVRLA